MRGHLVSGNGTPFHHSAYEAITDRALTSRLSIEARLLKEARRQGSEARLLPEASLFSQRM